LDDDITGIYITLTGNLSVVNETVGYLILNETGNILFVCFEGYNETNVTEFRNKTIEITGYIYQVCDCGNWNETCIKDIETIQIVDE